MEMEPKTAVVQKMFLGGRVRKITLPTLTAPPDSPLSGIKRLLLEQGELAQFYDGEEGMRYIAAIELHPGAVRGNHYHKSKIEWLYLLQGELVLRVMGVGDGTRDSLVLMPGELAVIPAGVAHALHTRAPGYAIEFSPIRFDPADTYRQVIPS
jgi:mannose-6-phosphate isomerase-like protein (cupin superfamily)